MRGAWIEIFRYSPNVCWFVSLPVRGAWIEMRQGSSSLQLHPASLPVRGAWIEILKNAEDAIRETSRSPCGERGLKYSFAALLLHVAHVAPRAGSVD